jgi:hypothetical protein
MPFCACSKANPLKLSARNLESRSAGSNAGKNSFVAAGSAELAKRKDGSSKSWTSKHSGAIRQWTWLLVALLAVITLLVLFMQRSPQE